MRSNLVYRIIAMRNIFVQTYITIQNIFNIRKINIWLKCDIRYKFIVFHF